MSQLGTVLGMTEACGFNREDAPGWARYPDYKDSGVEWLGEIPAHWEVAALQYRYAQSLGKMLDTKQITGNHLVPYLRNVDVQWDHINLSDLPTMDILPHEIERFTVRSGDLLVCEGGEAGRCAIWQGELDPCGYQKALHRLRPRDSVRDAPRFLYFTLSAAAVRGAFSSSQGSTIDHLTGGVLRTHRFAFPPTAEQYAIARFLDRETAKIDALVAKQCELISLLEEQRSALISHAVAKGLDPDATMKDSGVEWLGEIPAHWEVKKLGYITECLDGRRVPLNAEQRGRMQGGYPYWGANSIVDHVDSWLFDEELVLLGEDGAPFFDADRPVAFHVSGRIWVNNHAHVLRPAAIVFAAFLTSALNCVDYSWYIAGATRDKLTQSDMRSIPVQLPPAYEQHEISTYLEAETRKLDRLVSKAHQAIGTLNEYRTALISAAVTGKIDVRRALEPTHHPTP